MDEIVSFAMKIMEKVWEQAKGNEEPILMTIRPNDEVVMISISAEKENPYGLQSSSIIVSADSVVVVNPNLDNITTVLRWSDEGIDLIVETLLDA